MCVVGIRKRKPYEIVEIKCTVNWNLSILLNIYNSWSNIHLSNNYVELLDNYVVSLFDVCRF